MHTFQFVNKLAMKPRCNCLPRQKQTCSTFFSRFHEFRIGWPLCWFCICLLLGAYAKYYDEKSTRQRKLKQKHTHNELKNAF